MDACTVAGAMPGRIELTPMRGARLRAIDHAHQQRLFALFHAAEGEPERMAPRRGSRRDASVAAERRLRLPHARAAGAAAENAAAPR